MAPLKKINLNSINELRTALDDELPSVLSNLGYAQDFKLIDTKLALGYLSVIFAALCFFVDKKYSFSDAFNTTKALVILYFLLSGIVLYISKFIEKEIKYTGSNSNHRITISTHTEKYNPVYHIKLSSGNKTLTTSKEFMAFFDSFGYLQKQLLLEFLKSELNNVIEKSK